MRTFRALGLASLLGWSAAAACGGGGDGTIGLCKSDKVRVQGQCLDDISVSANGVGYLPERRKTAVFVSDSAEYEIRDAETDEVVLSGDAEGPMLAEDTFQEVYRIDFDELTTPGTYYVRTGDGQVSGEFKIGSDVLERALDAAFMGLHGQRCGEAVTVEFEDAKYTHAACHLAEADASAAGESGTKDDTGGWHDAGDYGKYVVNGAFAAAFLLKAYEHFPEYVREREFKIPEADNDVPDMLDEARVELEWILKAQVEGGGFTHKVTAITFEGNVMPSSDGQDRFFFNVTTAATADAVAILAEAARIYEEFDADFAEECLEAAEAGAEFLAENTEDIRLDQMGSITGGYGANDRSARVWAYAELWETTGEAKYLESFEATVSESEGQSEFGVSYNFDWSQAGNLGVRTYLDSEKEGRNEELVESLTRGFYDTAEGMVAAATADPYRRGFDSYYWGTNGVVLRMAFNLTAVHSMFPNTDYLDAITAQIDHVLGLNGFARSYVTGLGSNPPAGPHHRPSTADGLGLPWPGLIVGGPSGDSLQGADIPMTEDGQAIEGLNWQDDQENYYHNEIAINWNTALIYALVAAQATAADESAECVPDCLPPEAMGGASAGGAGGGTN